jgi:hypothetical protein
MPPYSIDRCPVCAGLNDYQRLLQGYLRDRCARLFSPQISAMLFRVQVQIKACAGRCAWSLAAVDLHSDISALLSEIWERVNDHKLYLEYAFYPVEWLRWAGLDLNAMHAYLDSHGILPMRRSQTSDSGFAAALDKYLNLCDREGLHHIVARWVKALEPEMVLEPPF